MSEEELNIQVKQALIEVNAMRKRGNIMGLEIYIDNLMISSDENKDIKAKRAKEVLSFRDPNKKTVFPKERED